MARILVINGPNLNMLGTREPEIYGSTTLSDVEALCTGWGAEMNLDVDTFQSNHEGAIVDAIQAARRTADGIVLNGGAYTHYSYAIHDALVAADLPAVEIHISNIHAREAWRRTSVTAPACLHQIFGRGVDGYRDAIRYMAAELTHPAATLSYGGDDDQFGRLRLPDGAGPHPVVVLLHGGFWREIYTHDTTSLLAVDLARRGHATWNLEYRRIPPTGGWRATLGDAAAGIDHLAAIDAPLDLDRVTVLGHSAGGHLALMAPRSTDIRPVSLVSLAGVLDLDAVLDPSDPDNGPLRFAGTDDPETIASLSPLHQIPPPAPAVVVHGTEDDTVPFESAVRYVKAAEAAGADVRSLWLDGVDHMAVIDPATDAWSAIVEMVFGD